jgi:hypothetical protein
VKGHPIVAIEGNASEQPAAPAQGPSASGQPAASRGEEPLSRRSARRVQVERFVRAVRDSDVAAAQAGATGAVKTVKMTAKLVPSRVPSRPLPGPDDPGR